MAKKDEGLHYQDPKKCVSVGLFIQTFSDYLIRSIQSVLEQRECLEIFILFPSTIQSNIVDTYSARFKDSRVNFLRNDSNNKIKHANKVASSFRGEYYVFLNERDILTPDSFAAALRQLKQPSHYVLAHGFADKIDNSHGNRQSFESLNQQSSIQNFCDGSSMALATIIIKRSAWLLLRGFDESLSFCYELDFAIRAYQAFSDRILLIGRIQAEVSFDLDETTPIELRLQRIFETYFIFRRYNLNADKFLDRSFSRSMELLTSLSEAKSFISKTKAYIDEHTKRFGDDLEEIIFKNTALSDIDIESVDQMETQGLRCYEKDGLAAGLISSISLQMYSGYFVNAKGPYATYTSIRSSFSESIKYIKHLEKCSLIVKGRKISGGFKDKPFGVNLIGHAFDVFGLGEALRMIAKALIDAEVPLSIIDIPACNGCPRENNFLEDYIETNFTGIAPYAFNIICMSPSSHAKWLLDGGLDLSLGRYSISAWFWETSTWPSPWEKLFQFIDASWAFSSLIHQALLPHCEKNNVLLEKARFPAEISTEEILQRADSKQYYRSKFNLPVNKIIFIFSFDPKSQIERKNPAACIKVFHDAFGDIFSENHRTDVCLVIKTFKPETNTHDWDRLLRIASSDSRIILVVESLERSNLLELYSCCDVFLSLHRSEGYGLGIAEALQLGLKVVVTGYGGNIDFCKFSSAYLIDYKLVPIPRGSYPLSIGHFWAEPDLANAVQVCQQVVIDVKDKPSRIVDDKLKEFFAISIAGKSFKHSLKQIY